MTQTLSAIYDGEVFKLESPLAFQIKPNTRVQIIVSSEDESEPISFFGIAAGLVLDGPADWSERVDEYLYGDVWKMLDQAENNTTDIS